MIQNLMKSNPKIAQAVPIVKQIMSEGGTKKEQLAKACKIANLNAQEVEKQLINNGIDLK